MMWRRLRVLDPYRSAFDPKHVKSRDGLVDAPPHKYLFHCYMYEFHTLRLAILVEELVRFSVPNLLRDSHAYHAAERNRHARRGTEEASAMGAERPEYFLVLHTEF